MSCIRCHSPIPPGSRFCPACGSAAGLSDVATIAADDATRLTPPASCPPPGRRPSNHGGSQTATSGQSGWLTSSGSIDHGRFGPGTVLDGRYRVLGLLGRGGMGEVYRADDLRLGQQVALKFLPPDLSRDPVRLAQFHNEVRTARQVSHPNVCRVYDIGEIEGQLFITMEYVDGEDLSILLRRIGRLPEDKALEIARQVCAGLAAAHERGVLHRDLKPANIMLDGGGRVRLMDFSLAAVGEVKDIRAGTPAYMAPEQLGGQEVTVRSDIYALGLVLYEIFTGRRAFDARTLTELIEQHQLGVLTPPTSIVRTLDPAIEMAIVRCLDPEPSRRPLSAIGVSAALPGGDPLAAALAAGETPSPEMVAAAGTDTAALTRVAGALWVAATVGLVVAVAAIMGRYGFLARVPLTRPAAVLLDRAEELRQSLGYTDPAADHAYDFNYDTAFINWARDHKSGEARWPELRAGRPAAVRFWYRTSPRALVPFNKGSAPGLADPPPIVNGMTTVLLDTKGRLLRFEAAVPQVEAAAAAPSRADWTKLFAAAGLDPAAFTEAAPSRTPATYADDRRAWKGTLPETTIPITIEAAAYRGRPVLFEVVAPWTPATREPGTPARSGGTLFINLLLAGAAVAAYANVRRGRADTQGAFRIAAFSFLVIASIWLLGRHVSDAADEQQRFYVNLGLGLFVGGAMYLIYIGLEPFVRRSWPAMLVAWSRLLAGRIRDPLVGRDLLVGVTCGTAMVLLYAARNLAPITVGWAEPTPHQTDFASLISARLYAYSLLGAVNTGLQNAMINVFNYAVLRAVFEWITRSGARWSSRRWPWAGRLAMSDRTSLRVFVAGAILLSAATSYYGSGPAGPRLIGAAYDALNTALILMVLLRYGIFASAIMFFANSALVRVPLTFDGNALYATASRFTMALVIGLAALGFWWATERRRRTV